MSEPLVIWGAGAIGGTIGAHLVQAGHDVIFVDIVAEHVEQIRNGNLVIDGPVSNLRVGAPAFTPETFRGVYRRFLLAVKTQHTAIATRMLKKHLAADGYVLSCQNGMNEPAIAEIVGKERTIGAWVSFAPDWIEPGRITLGNRGPFAIGELDGAITPRLQELHTLLRDFEPNVILSDDIYGLLWSKMSLAMLLKASALSNDTFSDFIIREDIRPLVIDLVAEIVHLAHALGHKLHAFQHFDPEIFVSGDAKKIEQSLVQHADLRRGSTKQHSGIWRDLAVRMRPSEAIPILAPIQKLASQAGIRTDLADHLVVLIARIERGENKPGDGLELELMRGRASVQPSSHQ